MWVGQICEQSFSHTPYHLVISQECHAPITIVNPRLYTQQCLFPGLLRPIPSDLIAIFLCLQQRYQVNPSPHLLPCKFTVHNRQPLFRYKKACRKANRQRYQSCKTAMDGAAILVFSDPDTIFVESVGYYGTHGKEVE